jgi:hypothetical protein
MNNDNDIVIGTECLVAARTSLHGERTWHLTEENAPRRFKLLSIVPDIEDGITPVFVFAAPDGVGHMSKYWHEIHACHE